MDFQEAEEIRGTVRGGDPAQVPLRDRRGYGDAVGVAPRESALLERSDVPLAPQIGRRKPHALLFRKPDDLEGERQLDAAAQNFLDGGEAEKDSDGAIEATGVPNRVEVPTQHEGLGMLGMGAVQATDEIAHSRLRERRVPPPSSSRQPGHWRGASRETETCE